MKSKAMRSTNLFFWSLFLLAAASASFTASGQESHPFPLKLRVGTYNVGHFNQGSLGGFQESGAKAQAELNNWRTWIGQQSLDIFVVNEWNKYFSKDSSSIASQELLEPFYAHIYFGKQNKWIYNGIATNFELDHIRQVDWEGDYYAVIGELKVGDKIVHVISTHIPWQKQWHDKSMQELIAQLKQYEYFICMGDMNAFDKSQELFLQAGFNMANGGYLGWFPTASGRISASGYGGKTDDNIDNIVTSKNIKIMRVSAPKTGLNDLDHRPILADLVITR